MTKAEARKKLRPFRDEIKALERKTRSEFEDVKLNYLKEQVRFFEIILKKERATFF